MARGARITAAENTKAPNNRIRRMGPPCGHRRAACHRQLLSNRAVREASGLAPLCNANRARAANDRTPSGLLIRQLAPMLAWPKTLRSAVIAISPNWRGGMRQICGFINSTDTWPA